MQTKRVKPPKMQKSNKMDFVLQNGLLVLSEMNDELNNTWKL